MYIGAEETQNAEGKSCPACASPNHAKPSLAAGAGPSSTQEQQLTHTERGFWALNPGGSRLEAGKSRDGGFLPCQSSGRAAGPLCLWLGLPSAARSISKCEPDLDREAESFQCESVHGETQHPLKRSLGGRAALCSFSVQRIRSHPGKVKSIPSGFRMEPRSARW